MHSERPSIWRSVVVAYCETARALRAMPAVTLAAFILLVMFTIATILGPLDRASPQGLLFELAYAIAWSFLLTPVLIAVHRFILLDETARHYRPGDGRRFVRFFVWSLAINLVLVMPATLSDQLADTEPALPLVILIVAVIMALFALRLTVLFPAIAVDAAGATWRHAYDDTRGHVLRILGTFVLAWLPFLAAGAVLSRSLPLPGSEPEVAGVASAAVVYAALSLFQAALFVAIASGFYRWMGQRVQIG